jgi:putative acetyltransferase
VSLDVSIRPEQPADHDAIHQVVGRAFDDESTAELVRLIRASANYVPSFALVAETVDLGVVGHIMLSRLDLDDGTRARRVLTLSPVSVLPEVQRRGVGSALILDALDRAERAGEPLIVLEGSPAYYPRFGFEPAVDHGVRIHLPSWAPPEAAMVRRLSRYTPALRGTVVYPAAFDGVTRNRDR